MSAQTDRLVKASKHSANGLRDQAMRKAENGVKWRLGGNPAEARTFAEEILKLLDAADEHDQDAIALRNGSVPIPETTP